MRVTITADTVKLWVSATNTWDWAYGFGPGWPYSELAGRRVFAEFDCNGLIGLTVNGKDDVDVNGLELSALCRDMLAARLPQEHPAYQMAVDLHEE